jgi:hypothetical protein
LDFDEGEILEEFNKSLDIFKTALTVLQSENSPTINLIIAFIADIKNK